MKQTTLCNGRVFIGSAGRWGRIGLCLAPLIVCNENVMYAEKRTMPETIHVPELPDPLIAEDHPEATINLAHWERPNRSTPAAFVFDAICVQSSSE